MVKALNSAVYMEAVACATASYSRALTGSVSSRSDDHFEMGLK